MFERHHTVADRARCGRPNNVSVPPPRPLRGQIDHSEPSLPTRLEFGDQFRQHVKGARIGGLRDSVRKREFDGIRLVLIAHRLPRRMVIRGGLGRFDVPFCRDRGV